MLHDTFDMFRFSRSGPNMLVPKAAFLLCEIRCECVMRRLVRNYT